MWEDWNESPVTLRFKEYLSNRIEEIGQNYKESIMMGEPQQIDILIDETKTCEVFATVLGIDLIDLNGVSHDV